jgi:hypothetical protein
VSGTPIDVASFPQQRQGRLAAGLAVIALLGTIALVLGVAAHDKVVANARPKPAPPLTAIEVRVNAIAAQIVAPINALPQTPAQVAAAETAIDGTLARVQAELLTGWPVSASQEVATWSADIGKVRTEAARGAVWSSQSPIELTPTFLKDFTALFHAQGRVLRTVGRK